VVSFLFAVIHPQGFLAVPPLMSLALAFTLMREWRGTLLPPMIAHGINNAVATLLLFLMS
jgi:membrane protease YdiL (CAAX protease family)